MGGPRQSERHFDFVFHLCPSAVPILVVARTSKLHSLDLSRGRNARSRKLDYSENIIVLSAFWTSRFPPSLQLIMCKSDQDYNAS